MEGKRKMVGNKERQRHTHRDRWRGKGGGWGNKMSESE